MTKQVEASLESTSFVERSIISAVHLIVAIGKSMRTINERLSKAIVT